MQALEKVMIPVDFSPAATAAAGYGGRIAAEFGATMTLLHVVRPLQFDFAMTEPGPEVYAGLVQARTKAVRETLERFAARNGEDVKVRTEVLEGDAADEIVAR